VNLESFELVLLWRSAEAPDLDEKTLDQLQAGHIAHMARLREEGQIVTNGPVLNQPDETLRGFAIYQTGSLDRARELAEQDPSVRAGRLRVDVMTWWAPAGTMVKPGVAVDHE
jgi:uncharacterized protein YciI